MGNWHSLHWLMRTGIGLNVFAFCFLMVSWIVCIVAQAWLPDRIPNFVVFLAYFGGPLPVIPAFVSVCGLISMAASWAISSRR